MATIAAFRLPATDTALGSTLEAHPSLTGELERVVESDRSGIWLTGPNRSEIEDALADDPSVDDYEHVTTNDERWLYDIAFTDEVCAIVDLFVAPQGTLLSAKAANGTWVLRVRYPDREHLSEAYERLRERDLAVEVGKIYDLTEHSSVEIGLTPHQYESIVAAVEHGYFEIPRRISMQELAVELDISHQALSERLRRAYGTLASVELDLEPRIELEFVESD
ncbi:helix-turn-helix domain-containing protein [Halobacteria archaeon AArc-m2/3/4]|uniref:Helix-turn-helix domain-containing protein n=1 Tax=Natronoglomus mannanivorans TaxID=2979990 RepID=A0AAP3E139_9EURY|nr:helix-turn-helix domain-containing protein [Halobacteria archaeon AArc-xg1-1]MCU4973654.1 helix-turn-helix domain-containing protein [Halobacteria archaeon AArc-m2/3/4]